MYTVPRPRLAAQEKGLAGSAVYGAGPRANCGCRPTCTLPEQMMMMMMHPQSWRHGLRLLRETRVASYIAASLHSYDYRVNEKPCSEYFSNYIKLS